jgi:gliding motility-associated-like protein
MRGSYGYLILGFVSSFIINLVPAKAQNLVPNYSFEDVNPCPTQAGGWGATVAFPWIGPTPGTPDIFHACGSGPADVPDNFAGSQMPNTGSGYAGVYVYVMNSTYREYLQAPLLETLVAGQVYHVSFYVSLADFACASGYIGAYISVNAPNSGFSNGPLQVTPQIESNIGFMSDNTGWTLISGCFTAEGGEQFITFGNFREDFEVQLLQPCFNGLSYYYVDDIVIEAVPGEGDIDVNLGGPALSCDEYVIDPGYSGYYYSWSDGSHDETLTVNESGVYHLTISDGCSFGSDSIEVYIHGQSEVNIGPEEVTICEGESYVITLDPNFNDYTWNDGSTDHEYTITESGTYSVTLDDGCATSSDEITVNVLSPPEPFDLGDNDYMCFDDEIEYEFDPELGDFLWQDNSMSSSYTITTPGTYILTISNQCGSESDMITYTGLEAPMVNIGPDTTTLCSGQTLQINIDPGPGEIEWQDGSASPSYTISQPGTYQVSVTNICGIATDNMLVLVNETPTVDFGNDTILCNSGTLVLTSPTENGIFTWQDNSSNDSLVVNSSGTYALTVQNNCGIATDTIQVTYAQPVMPVNLGADVTLCPGEQFILDAQNPGASYLWQDMSTADTLVVTTSGSYSVVISSLCNSVTDTINITFANNPPHVDLPEQLTLCQGQTIILDAVIGGVSYQWNDMSALQQLSVTSPGIYSVTVSNSCGMDQDTVTILDGGPAPVVELGSDIELCPGTQVLLNPTFSNVDTWLWQDGSVLSSFNISGPGQISVQANNSCGVAYDTLQVTLLPALPVPDLGADTLLCPGDEFLIILNVTGVDIVWHDGSTLPDFQVTEPGEIIAMISNHCGSLSDTLLVTALADVPPLDLGPDQSLCPGELISIDPDVANVDYIWQDGSTGPVFQTTQPGTIILTITNTCGQSTDTMVISENTTGPQINLGEDVHACEGSTVIIEAGILGVDYLWQDGSTGPTITMNQSGMVILEVSNNCGSDQDTLIVDISGNGPAVNLGPDTTLCEGIALLLTGPDEINASILWQDGSSDDVYTVTQPGTYFLTATNSCGNASDTITVSYQDAPDPFSLGPDTLLCLGETILLSSPSIFYDVMWQDGSGMLHLVVNHPGTYSLTLSNACGTANDEITIDYDTRVPQIDIEPIHSWCEGDVISFDVTQPFDVTYLWNTGASNPSISISTPGTYTVDIATSCLSRSFEFVVEEDVDCQEENTDDVKIYIPNVFSPNGDGVNDTFSPGFNSGLNVVSVSGKIYDRWGGLVYSSTGPNFSWDGKLSDEVMMTGVYVYVLRIEFVSNGKSQIAVYTGDITLVR